ncbi:MAG: hypothetical protein GC160_03135 [Acidobacteria bacterium]|nr:hypothetical protein [Acidobacteriota bacterium]
MKRTLVTLAFALALPLAAADKGSWDGMLVDAACKQRTPQAACPVDASTTTFGVATKDGRFLPFDAEGNRKSAYGVRGLSEKINPQIVVTGSSDGKTIAVESIQAP